MSTLTAPSRERLDARPDTRLAPAWLTWALAAVLVAATTYGLLADIYRETPARENLAATLRGQDLLTLLTVPALLVATHLAARGSLRAHLVSLGVLLYVPYTYLMYVVLPYSDAFLLHVGAIGLGAYLLFVGLLRLDVRALEPVAARVPRRGLGWFLIVTGSLFATLWLATNLSVLPGGVPEGLFVYDIPSTVHVLDLAFVLPTLIASGVLLLRGRPLGLVLATIMLVKMVTLGLALVFMNGATAVVGATFNVGESALWATIAVVAIVLLVRLFRSMGELPRQWTRPAIW